MLLLVLSAAGLLFGVDFGVDVASCRLVGRNCALEAFEDFLTSIGLEERITAGEGF